MTLLDFVDKYVMADVPGCPTAVAKEKAFKAAQDFLTFSQVWVEVQDPEYVVARVRDYPLWAPTGARCIDILNIYTRAGALVPRTIQQLADEMPNWQSAEGSVPQFYTRSFDFTTFYVYPLPTDPGDETLSVHGVYTLKEGATSILDEIVERFGEVIAHGAKERLMTMAGGVTWANPQLAIYHRNEYDTGRSVARITAAHGKTSGAAVARPRRFGQ